jgi:ribosomal protein S18 acetylase RimI-like enzyme
MLEKYFLRRPAASDAEAVLELMRRTDVRDVGFADTDMPDLLHDWERCNPAQDAWLAIDVQGQMRGYGACLPWDEGYRLTIYDDVGTEQGDLFLGLLILCEKRAAALIQDSRQDGKDSISSHASITSTYQARILEEAGFSQNRFIFNMHMDLAGQLPAAEWPDHISIRTAIKEKDEREIYELIESSFDWRERRPQTYEEWGSLMVRPDLYDEKLWFLAEQGGQLIGACLGVPYEEIGWVRQLAVRKALRGRGIGRALLLQAFRAFQERGYRKAGLAVESRNPDAYQFYEKMGMTRAVHLVEYIKKVPI